MLGRMLNGCHLSGVMNRQRPIDAGVPRGFSRGARVPHGSSRGERARGRVSWLSLGLGALLLFGCRGSSDVPPTAEEPDEVIRTDLEPDELPPVFEFPDEVRVRNEELNAFIDEFKRICEEGRYRDYRLAVSRMVEPFEKRRFDNIWHAIQAVRVRLIKRLPASLELPEPAYAILIFADLRDTYPTDKPRRIFTVLAFQEEGQWVVAPAPMNVNRAMRVAAGLSAEEDDPFAELEEGTPSDEPPSPPASQPADTSSA
jgi:hypothetical protein